MKQKLVEIFWSANWHPNSSLTNNKLNKKKGKFRDNNSMKIYIINYYYFEKKKTEKEKDKKLY